MSVSYEHLIKELKLNKIFNKFFNQVVSPVHINDYGIVYFWGRDLGYVNDPKSSPSFVKDSVMVGLNSLRFSLTDLDEARVLMYNFSDSLTSIRMTKSIALTVPLIVASLYTNAFTALPMTTTGNLNYNPYYIAGDTECITSAGIQPLKFYSSFYECLDDLTDTIDLVYDEEECFKLMHKHFKFSLTLYNYYFLLTMYLMYSGGNLHERVREMDSNGMFRRFRRARSFLPPSKVFGVPDISKKRPRGTEEKSRGSGEEN